VERESKRGMVALLTAEFITLVDLVSIPVYSHSASILFLSGLISLVSFSADGHRRTASTASSPPQLSQQTQQHSPSSYLSLWYH